jgi:hypothetical protein
VLCPRTLVAGLTFSSHLQPSLFADVAVSGCGAGFFRSFKVFALDVPALHMFFRRHEELDFGEQVRSYEGNQHRGISCGLPKNHL